MHNYRPPKFTFSPKVWKVGNLRKSYLKNERGEKVKMNFKFKISECHKYPKDLYSKCWFTQVLMKTVDQSFPVLNSSLYIICSLTSILWWSHKKPCTLSINTYFYQNKLLLATLEDKQPFNIFTMKQRTGFGSDEKTKKEEIREIRRL